MPPKRSKVQDIQKQANKKARKSTRAQTKKYKKDPAQYSNLAKERASKGEDTSIWGQVKKATSPGTIGSGLMSFGKDAGKTMFNISPAGQNLHNARMSFDKNYRTDYNDKSIGDKLDSLAPVIHDTGVSVGDSGERWFGQIGETGKDLAAGRYEETLNDIRSNPMFTITPAGSSSLLFKSPEEVRNYEGWEDAPYAKAAGESGIVGAAIEDIGNATMILGGAGAVARGFGKAALTRAATKSAVPRSFSVAADGAAVESATSAANMAKAASLTSKGQSAIKFADGLNVAAQPIVNTARAVGLDDAIGRGAAKLASTKAGTKIGKYAAHFSPNQRETRRVLSDAEADKTRSLAGTTEKYQIVEGIAGKENMGALTEVGEKNAIIHAKAWQTFEALGGEQGAKAWNDYKNRLAKESKDTLTPDDIQNATDAHIYQEALKAGDNLGADIVKKRNPNVAKIANAMNELRKGEFGIDTDVDRYLDVHPEQGSVLTAARDMDLDAEYGLPGARQNFEQAVDNVLQAKINGADQGTVSRLQYKADVAELAQAPAMLRPIIKTGQAARGIYDDIQAQIKAQDPDLTDPTNKQTYDFVEGQKKEIASSWDELIEQGEDWGLWDADGNISKDALAFFSHFDRKGGFYQDVVDGKTSFYPQSSPASGGKLDSIKKMPEENLRKGSTAWNRSAKAMAMRAIATNSQLIARKVWDELTNRGVVHKLDDIDTGQQLSRTMDPGDFAAAQQLGYKENGYAYLADGSMAYDGRIYPPLREALADLNDQRRAAKQQPLELVNPRDPLGRALDSWPQPGSVLWRRNEMRLVPADVRESFTKNFQRVDSKGQDILRLVFDKPNQIMKYFALALSPAWHAMNIIGNAGMAMIAGGLTPLDLSKSMMRVIDDYRKNADGSIAKTRRQVKKQLKSEGASPAALRAAKSERSFFDVDTQRLETSGLTQAQQEWYATPLGNSPLRETTDKLTRGHRPFEALVNRSYEMNSFFDNLYRAAVFDSKKMKGLPTERAIKETLNAMGDFQRMSPFERNWVRRVFPFYTWQKHVATNLVTRLPIEHPFRVAWTLSIANQYATEDGLVNVWGNTYIDPVSMVPFADAGRLFSKDAIATSLGPVPRLAIGELTNANLSKGAQRSFNMPPGMDGEMPALFDPSGEGFNYGRVPDAFAGKQLRLVRGVTGADQISRYDNGEPMLQSGFPRPYKQEGRSPLAALGGYAGFRVASPEVSKNIESSKKKKKARNKESYENYQTRKQWAGN